MDGQARQISRITRGFYEKHAASFSQTRQRAWTGWQRLAVIMRARDASTTVLDVACGNQRFERFLAQEGFIPDAVYAVDACEALLATTVPEMPQIEHVQADILELLDAGYSFKDVGIPACSLTVCFGFMHHVPTSQTRCALLEQLLAATQPKGICALSFWQFQRDEKLWRKAAAATKDACARFDIELAVAGDAFLGWQDATDAFRFCHAFSDDEVDALRESAERLGARTLDDFRADGKHGDLDRYLVFEVC